MFDNHFVSQEGLDKLKTELEHRERVLRREIAEKISTAKDQGDLSENFEYQESKDQQALNESRIIELRDVINRAVVTAKDEQDSTIQIGSSFIATLDDGSEKTFSLVGPTEADPVSGKISNDSPLGQQFFGKNIGDTVKMNVPSGVMTYTITKLL